MESCASFTSTNLDQSILREVLKELKTPPMEILKLALKASQRQKQSRHNRIKSERERLAHEVRIARERAELTQANRRRDYFDAPDKLENVLEEKEFANGRTA